MWRRQALCWCRPDRTYRGGLTWTGPGGCQEEAGGLGSWKELPDCALGGPGFGARQPVQGTCPWESELGSNPDSSLLGCVTALSELQFAPLQDEDGPVLLGVRGQSSCEKPDTEVSHVIEAGRWSQ